jgi:hypothetical protein
MRPTPSIFWHNYERLWKISFFSSAEKRVMCGCVMLFSDLSLLGCDCYVLMSCCQISLTNLIVQLDNNGRLFGLEKVFGLHLGITFWPRIINLLRRGLWAVQNVCSAIMQSVDHPLFNAVSLLCTWREGKMHFGNKTIPASFGEVHEMDW